MSNQLNCAKVNEMNQFLRSNVGHSNFVYNGASYFVGRPIPNMVNTCFVGSVLQCLNSFDKILRRLVEHKFNHQIVYDQNEYQLMDSYVNLVYNGLNQRVKNGQRESKRLFHEFFDKLYESELNQHFIQFQQNDCNEFLTQFFAYIDKCAIEIEIGKRGLRANIDSAIQLESLYETYKFTHNLISQDFLFRTTQQMICSKNSLHVKNLESTNLCLQLPLDSSCKTLDDCLQIFSRNERIEGANCNQCNLNQTFNSKTLISSTNNCLIIVLLRFTIDSSGSVNKRVSPYLDITETLDLTNYVAAGSRSSNALKYNLAGICFHLGETPNSGHITSLVICDVKKVWYYFDDEVVDKFKSLDEFKRKKRESSQAYMLFYKAIENDHIISTSEDEIEVCELQRNVTQDSLMSIQQTPISDKRRIYQVVDSSNERIGSNSLNSMNFSNNNNRMSEEIREKDRNRKRIARLDEDFRSAERIRNKEWNAQARTIEEYRNSQRIRNKEWNAQARTIDEYRNSERIRDREWHVETRTDEEFRGPERARTDEEFRGPERVRDRNWHVEARTDEEFRGPERVRDRNWHDNARSDEEFRNRERENDRINRSERRNNPNFIINSYENGVKNGPTFICVCCGGLYFRRTCVSFICDKNNEFLNLKIYNLKFLNTNEPLWICLTCNKYAKIKKVPTLALSKGLHFPSIDHSLVELNDLEERLCSPRIAFTRIKELCNWDKQKRLIGNVVNIPIDTEQTLTNLLPRQFDQSETIQLKFMRRIDYTNPYYYDKIRPAKILAAMNFLVRTELFKENNIKFSQDFFDKYGLREEERAFIVDDADANFQDKNINWKKELRMVQDASQNLDDSIVDVLKI
ncbi:ATP-dependent DNA helicase PIF1 [Brachionus plicatilis]|uniref:ATP-dependent DNA helicase PIF1 n=1 Tax=Brachionus plicatilis TaxID=10195 RepID=A0A3M7PTS5_BRAPC|nr:ATP-dependent DNA helicase PIF1 [Brachionus plicatilis]